MFIKFALLFSIIAFSNAKPFSIGNDGLIQGSNENNPVIGGEKMEVPLYHVSIQQGYMDREPWLDHRCDGALINQTWILSSASCILPIHFSDLYVVAGNSYHFSGKAPYPPENYRKVVKVVLHPHYNLTQKQALHDVALLKLESSFNKTNGRILSAKLPQKSPVPANFVIPARTSMWGWGDPKVRERYSEGLQKLNVTIINYIDCRTRLETLVRGPARLIEEYHICAESTVPGAAVCNKAYGAPLVTYESQSISSNTIIGIFSRGMEPCSNISSIGVYTNVYSYSKWIDNTITNN